MGELWRTRQWRKLLNLIDHLPGHSLYAEAVAQDDEAAERYLDAAGGGAHAYRPRLSDWTPEVAALGQVVDRLANVFGAIVAGNGQPPPRLPPFPRPEVAADRAVRRRQLDRHQQNVKAMLPDRQP